MENLETNPNSFKDNETEQDILEQIKEDERRVKDQERFNELSGLSNEDIETEGKDIKLDDEGRVVEEQ